MTSVPNLSGSIVAANNQNIAGLVNINLDVSLVRCSAPEEFSSIGPSLSLHRRKEAEGGQQHKLASRLGFLFNDIIPATPKLIKAFGTRVSDILRRPGVNPQGSNEDGPFRDFVGADGTSIWAAATSMSASLSVYLLACMLARAWDAKQATAIWVELVHERKLQVQAKLEQNSIVNPYTHVAAMQDFNRDDLARWDASARSWLRRADQCTVFQHTQFKLVIDNIRLPFLDSGTTFDKVTRAWIRSMEVLETLLGNEPQVAFDRSVLLAISSWHLYPNLLVFQEEATNVSFSDELFPALGVLSLGFEYHAPSKDVQNRKGPETGLGMATRWSLALSHLRYYGSPVQVRSEESQRERATIDEMWLTCLGAILRQWEVSISNLDVSVQWFQKIGDLLHPIEESEKTVLSWLSQLCRAANSVSSQHHTKRPDRMRFVMFGWRKDTQLLGYQKVLRPPFFGLCNPDVLGSLSKKDGTEIGFEFFRRVAQRLNLSPDHAIICRSKEDDNFNEAYEWATISPVQAGLDGPRQLDENGSSLLRNARWLYAEDRKGRTIRSIGLQQRQTSIHRLGERCHIIHDPKHIPRKKKATWDSRDSRESEIVPAGLRVWENPPLLFAEDGQSAQFVELLFVPMPDSSAGFHMFVRKEVYEHRLNDLKSQMNRAAMELNVQESLKWLEKEGSSFDIVGFLMGFVQVSRLRATPSYAF